MPNHTKKSRLLIDMICYKYIILTRMCAGYTRQKKFFFLLKKNFYKPKKIELKNKGLKNKGKHK
jgi:hypothetical protein